MKMYPISRRAVLVAIGGLLTVLSLSGVALAITDNVFSYSTPKTGHLALTPAAFTPADLSKNYANNGAAIRPLAAGQYCWSAPVNLPQSAEMSVLAVAYHLENGDTAFVQFYRQRFSDGVAPLIVSETLPLTGGSYEVASFPITNASTRTVDNRRYGYHVYVCMTENGAGVNSLFRGVRVTYTYATAGD